VKLADCRRVGANPAAVAAGRHMAARDLSYTLTRALAGSPLGAITRRVLPPTGRRVIRSAIELPVMRRVAADRRSLRLLLPVTVTDGPDQSPEPVSLRLRRLPVAPVHLRPGTADVAVARDLMLKQPHLPPDSMLPDDARLVWDLGAHIGLAAAGYATRWPHARVIAVELESLNARLCRRNLEPFGQRCEVVEAAVWHTEGEVSVGGDPDDPHTNSFRAARGSEGITSAAVPALSLDALLARAAPGERAVDLCKLDVEGAERQILRENTGWARWVRTLAVEVHDDYSPEDCRRDLERLGFERIERGRADNIVVGQRPNTPRDTP